MYVYIYIHERLEWDYKIKIYLVHIYTHYTPTLPLVHLEGDSTPTSRDRKIHMHIHTCVVNVYCSVIWVVYTCVCVYLHLQPVTPKSRSNTGPDTRGCHRWTSYPHESVDLSVNSWWYQPQDTRPHQGPENNVIGCLLWIDEARGYPRAKDKTYIWVSVWWKTKN